MRNSIRFRFAIFLITAAFAGFYFAACSDDGGGDPPTIAGPSPDPDKGRVVLFSATGNPDDSPVWQIITEPAGGPSPAPSVIDCDTCEFGSLPSGTWNTVFCVDDSLTEYGDTLYVELTALHSYGTFRVQWKRSDSIWLPGYEQELTYSNGKYSAWIDHNFAVQEGDTMVWQVYTWTATFPGYDCGKVVQVGGASGGIYYPRMDPPWIEVYSDGGGGGGGGKKPPNIEG